MEYTVNIDKQGRLVIPSPIREALGLKGGGEAVIRLDDLKLVIEIVDKDLEKKVEEWRKTALSLHAEPFTEEVEESWKWISREYAERKLGIPRRNR